MFSIIVRSGFPGGTTEGADTAGVDDSADRAGSAHTGVHATLQYARTATPNVTEAAHM